MKLSVVIPFYYAFPGKAELLHRAIKSLRGHDELIVIGHASKSLPWALNAGIQSAHGDFILIMSDDMYLSAGSLEDLCYERYVTHPKVHPLGGSMCFPRWVAEEVSYDEGYTQGYWDDDDMFAQLAHLGIERRVVTSVVIEHPDPGTTLNALAAPHFDDNRRRFESKWGPPVAWPEPEEL